MLPDLQDTIVALASAPGPGGRAIIRLSGPQAFAIACRHFTRSEKGSGTFSAAEKVPDPFSTSLARQACDRHKPHAQAKDHGRRCYEGQIHLSGVNAPLPADLLVWPGPRSYTGQDVAELHVISCPPLVDLLIGQLLSAGARSAQPGEFTLRAFLAGKLDLTRAEAVLGVIEAGNRDQLKQALAQLAGGVSRPLQELRTDLLDLLADVEAELDFTEEDIHFVNRDELLRQLASTLAHVTLLGKQLEQRAVSGGSFCVVLAGPPNAGKSSLFNALAGKPAALVSPQPCTTRDYLVWQLDLDGVPVELIDSAGWQVPTGVIEEQTQLLGREQAKQADLVLLCLEGGKESGLWDEMSAYFGNVPVATVATKSDLYEPPSPSPLPLSPAAGERGWGEGPATSALTGAGLDALRRFLKERAEACSRPALAPSLSRCQHHVAACLEHLRQAHATVLYEEPPELLALELRSALDQLGEMVGAVYTDDLLDRIFSRFCIGK